MLEEHLRDLEHYTRPKRTTIQAFTQHYARSGPLPVPSDGVNYKPLDAIIWHIKGLRLNLVEKSEESNGKRMFLVLGRTAPITRLMEPFDSLTLSLTLGQYSAFDGEVSLPHRVISVTTDPNPDLQP